MTKTVELTTNHGAIRIELDDAKAPLSVANFLSYVNSGHYDGTVFHRVIKGFMVQGGGFEMGMKQKPTGAEIQNDLAGPEGRDGGRVAAGEAHVRAFGRVGEFAD